MIGLHWIARAGGVEPRLLEDPDRLRRLLVSLPDALGLTRVGEPVVSGHAGVVLLSESHASLHCDPAGGLFADIFSCAPFDPGLAARLLEEAYAPASLSWRTLERGDGFEPSPGASPADGMPHHTSGLFRVRDPDGEVVAALEALGFGQGADRVQRFEPHGLSWLRRDGPRWVALHTWPERSLASVDVFASEPLDLGARLADLGWTAAQ